MSRDSKGPRKTFSKGGSSDFNKRKSFSSSDKPKRPSEGSSFKKRDGDSTEKRSYTKREDSTERPRKSFSDSEGKSSSGEKRTFGITVTLAWSATFVFSIFTFCKWFSFTIPKTFTRTLFRTTLSFCI